MWPTGWAHTSRNFDMPSVHAKRCGWCVRLFPLLFILGVVSWSYYAYVVRMCFGLDSGPAVGEKVFYLIVYHLLLLMFLWSWMKVALTKPASVPQAFYLPESALRDLHQANTDQEKSAVLEKFANGLPLSMRAVGSGVGIRYCEKCHCIKPDRAHHCSTCGMCVLKMDHHCPWINNCVGFNTYKYFLLFLFYAQLYCLFLAVTDAQYFARFWTNVASFASESGQSDFHVMFVFIIALMFGLAVLALFGYHIHLLSRNNSTQESLRAPIMQTGPVKDAFDLGAAQNLREIFGDRRALWCIPVWSSKGDGVHFESRCYSVGSGSTPNTVDDNNGGLLTHQQVRMQSASSQSSDAGLLRSVVVA